MKSNLIDNLNHYYIGVIRPIHVVTCRHSCI